MKKYGKRIITLVLLCVFVVALLPLRGSSVRGRPEDWMVDGRADFYQWDQVKRMNDIPNDGQWHRMMLLFQWDTGDKRVHYLNADWQLYEDRLKGVRRFHYYKTQDAAGDPNIDASDDRFYTPNHYKTFFVKRVGYDPNYDNITVIFRLGDANGAMTDEYIGLTDEKVTSYTRNSSMELVKSESEALVFNMVTKDSKENGNQVDEEQGTVLFFATKSPYWGFMDRGTHLGPHPWELHQPGVVGIMREDATWFYRIYSPFKMYLGGGKYTASFIESDFTVKAGKTQTINGLTYLNKGRTITVEKGGTLVIAGTLLSGGTIQNYGTVVVSRDASLGYDAIRSSSYKPVEERESRFLCHGGTLLVMEGAKVALPAGLTLSDGSVCHNFGQMVLRDGLIMGSSTFNNHLGAGIWMGYYYYDEPNTFSRNRPEVGVGKYTYKGVEKEFISMKNNGNFSEGSHSIGYNLYNYPDTYAFLDTGADFINSGRVQVNTAVIAKKGSDWCTQVNVQGDAHGGDLLRGLFNVSSGIDYRNLRGVADRLNQGWTQIDIESGSIKWN